MSREEGSFFGIISVGGADLKWHVIARKMLENGNTIDVASESVAAISLLDDADADFN